MKAVNLIPPTSAAAAALGAGRPLRRPTSCSACSPLLVVMAAAYTLAGKRS